MEALLDAIAVVRLRELRLQITQSNSLDALYAFADGFSPRVTLEVMDVLSSVAVDAKRSTAGASSVCDMVCRFMPIHSLTRRSHRPLTTLERNVVAEAQALAFDVAYHAARRSGDLRVLNAGARVLWSILRFAVLNDEPAMCEAALGAFANLKHWCEDSEFTDGHRWLTFLVEDATQLERFVGHYPRDIEAKLLEPVS